MRIVRTLFAVAMSLMLGLTALGSSPASAESVAVWVTIGTNRPAAACVVETNVEVRSGGGAVAGAEVEVILSDDASTAVISADSGLTDASGIAWLSYNTTGANVTKTWLEVRVNGTYIGGRTIFVDGTSCAGAPSLLDLSGDVPMITDSVAYTESAAAPAAEVAAVSDSSNGSFLPLVTYAQQRNLSCEYAAVQIATTMLGAPVSEYQMEAVTPLSPNPHWGYRGNINGQWGITDDYGIYADGLVPGLNAYGYSARTFYGGTDNLTNAIDNGNPVIVWLGMRGDGTHYDYTEDGTRYQLTNYMHVMVVYGYDDSGVYLSDPGTGATRFYDWDSFLYMWGIIDGMGLVVGE